MFEDLVNYVRTAMNLVAFDVFGRYVVETYDNGHGGEVVIDLWDREAQVVYRPGMTPIYREKVGE